MKKEQDVWINSNNKTKVFSTINDNIQKINDNNKQINNNQVELNSDKLLDDYHKNVNIKEKNNLYEPEYDDNVDIVNHDYDPMFDF